MNKTDIFIIVLLICIFVILIFNTIVDSNYSSSDLIVLENGTVSFISTTASNRLSFIDSRTGVFCSEPSPDALIDTASKTNIKGTANKEGVVNGEVDLSKIGKENTTKLFERSQAIQFFRDGMYYLCQTYANGIISKNEYVQAQTELRQSGFELLSREMSLKY